MPPEPPAPIVPTPASLFRSVRGRRVIVGVPGLGFRADLRADDPVVQGSRTYVPVLTEQDYYRAETEQIEVFASLVPVDRVWVEDIQDRVPLSASTPAALDSPPSSNPIPFGDARVVLGQRVIQAVPDGFVRDLRVVTNVYVNREGLRVGRICGEADWYRWALSGTTPATSEISVDDLWVE